MLRRLRDNFSVNWLSNSPMAHRNKRKMIATKIYSIKNVLKEQLMHTLYVFFYLKTRQELQTGAVMFPFVCLKRQTDEQTDGRQTKYNGKTSLKGSYLVSPTPLL